MCEPMDLPRLSRKPRSNALAPRECIVLHESSRMRSRPGGLAPSIMSHTTLLLKKGMGVHVMPAREQFSELVGARAGEKGGGGRGG